MEQELPGDVVHEKGVEVHPSMEDRGPAPVQVVETVDEEEYFEECSGGVTHNTTDTDMSVGNRAISSKFKTALQTKHTMNWPYTSSEALSEYGSEVNLFCKAFPWLFPGGVGDFSQYHHEKVDFDEWSRRMLCYEDGRFAKDKIWCFYALNVSNRKKKRAGGGSL